MLSNDVWTLTLLALIHSTQFGFPGGWDGYRDASCRGFLRNWALGKTPPHSGAPDEQVSKYLIQYMPPPIRVTQEQY
jgi:hypothetical protein